LYYNAAAAFPWSGLSAGHARFHAGIFVAQAFLPVFFPFGVLRLILI